MRLGPDSATARPGPPISSRTRNGCGAAAGAWLAVAAWVALVLWLGSGSFGAPTTSRILFPFLRWLLPHLEVRELLDLAMGIRKLAHPTVYGVLALLALNAWRLTFQVWWPAASGAGWRAGALAGALTLLVACADETRQAFLPGRSGSPWDVALDAAGALAAIGAAAALLRARRRRAARPAGVES